ncbi:uncharacterized protein LOC119583837 [Penaeus monodon]|uniref:uncharacterized protein LOC119583837 n=1 Tax=Penaeus monodon TaxID=6687 RepID=UPI0018A728EF|nr:uncharacterized protein LOC119583837 [Penaeus monodon]XP_037788495.1 uncharacterized protein LOC119583837 [Penaeus monodon]
MAVTSLIVVTLCFAAGQVTSAATDKKTKCGFESKGVYIAVTSEAEKVNDEYLRWLEAHWFGMVDVEDGDWVGLWSHDPEEGLDAPLGEYSVSTTDGSFRTGQRWNGSLIPDDLTGTQDMCLPYWVGYVNKGMLTHSSCLMIRPHWLSGLRASLMDTRLSKVVLPGSHDAGASGHFGLAIIGDLVGRWTFTQDESLWQQLVLGSRYLDIRIAYYNNTQEKFFINHGEVRIAPLQGYLDNVASFMEQTEEIVIFDIHGLQLGFDGHPERHEELIKLLESNFQKWMVPKSLSPDPTLGEIWTSGSRLIVTYPSSEASASPYFWNNVYHLWGDVNEVEDLEAFLYTSVPQQVNRGSLWSSMAELTPTVLDVTLDRWGGLRGAAAVTNTPVTQWVREDLWDQVNIVAMDFLPASDVVAIAIEANKLKTECVGKKRLTDRARRWMSVKDNYVNDVQAVVGNQMCADLVGAGGVGVRVWPSLQALPRRQTNNLQFRLIQINWEAEEVQEGDWIGVFERNPKEPPARSAESSAPDDGAPGRGAAILWEMPRPLFWDTPFSTSGRLTTNVSETRPELAALAVGGCIGHWVGYVRNGLCVAAQCLAAHPQWLWDNKDVLGSRSLRSLMLPGTHNAGSYSVKDTDDVVTAWVVCQDEDIISQLLYGIRYLDLRVGYYPDSPELLWINHDLVRWRPLVEVLGQINAFLTISRDPVLIDIHRMPVGFEHHEAIQLLLSTMNETLGDHFLSERYGSQVTLDQVWATGKRAIFAFADIDVSEEEDWVWPPLPQAWANAQTLEDLRGYLDTQMARRAASPRLWAAMVHLTPTFLDLLFRSHEGVRGMADRANPAVTIWLQKRWAHLANIVASDFFRGNDIVNVAIRTNLALSVCPSTSSHVASPLRRSTGFRLSELPRKLSNPIWETIKNFEEDLPHTSSAPRLSTPPSLLMSFTSTTPPFQRITTSSPPDVTTPPYQRVTTPPYQRVTQTPHYRSHGTISTGTRVRTTSSPTTTSPPPSTASPSSSPSPSVSSPASTLLTKRIQEDNSIPEGLEPQRPVSESIDLSLISPIHSILDLFGFDTTDTRPERQRQDTSQGGTSSTQETMTSDDETEKYSKKLDSITTTDDASDPRTEDDPTDDPPIVVSLLNDQPVMTSSTTFISRVKPTTSQALPDRPLLSSSGGTGRMNESIKQESRQVTA